jgi:hypothetical protein
MTVAELIAELAKLPAGANVTYIWDGHARGDVEHVWLARSGDVTLGHADPYVYDDDEPPESGWVKNGHNWQPIKSS